MMDKSGKDYKFRCKECGSIDLYQLFHVDEIIEKPDEVILKTYFKTDMFRLNRDDSFESVIEEYQNTDGTKDDFINIVLKEKGIYNYNVFKKAMGIQSI